jgi:hypothetical protein
MDNIVLSLLNLGSWYFNQGNKSIRKIPLSKNEQFTRVHIDCYMKVSTFSGNWVDS